MSYAIEIGPKAQKVMDKLPKEISLRIIKKLSDIRFNPFHFLEHLGGDNLYKLRTGDYRTLIEANNVKRVLVVRVIDKRSRVYKR